MFKKLLLKLKLRLGVVMGTPVPFTLQTFTDYENVLAMFKVEWLDLYTIKEGTLSIVLRQPKFWQLVKKGNIRRFKAHVDLYKYLGVYIDYP